MPWAGRGFAPGREPSGLSSVSPFEPGQRLPEISKETTLMTLSNESTTIEAVSPWWHTALLVVLIGLFSVQSAMNHGLPGFQLPGLNPRLSKYICVIVFEWI